MILQRRFKEYGVMIKHKFGLSDMVIGSKKIVIFAVSHDLIWSKHGQE